MGCSRHGSGVHAHCVHSCHIGIDSQQEASRTGGGQQHGAQQLSCGRIVVYQQCCLLGMFVVSHTGDGFCSPPAMYSTCWHGAARLLQVLGFLLHEVVAHARRFCRQRGVRACFCRDVHALYAKPMLIVAPSAQAEACLGVADQLFAYVHRRYWFTEHWFSC